MKALSILSLTGKIPARNRTAGSSAMNEKGRYALFLSGPVGVGKTTLGKGLAKRLGGSFIDGDDLADADRPWYGSIHSTCKAITRDSVSARTQYPFVVIAYPLPCVNWIYCRRSLAEVKEAVREALARRPHTFEVSKPGDAKHSREH